MSSAINTDIQEPLKPSSLWIHRNDDFYNWLECPKCGYGEEGEVKYGEGTTFCPYCGADLRRSIET